MKKNIYLGLVDKNFELTDEITDDFKEKQITILKFESTPKSHNVRF